MRPAAVVRGDPGSGTNIPTAASTKSVTTMAQKLGEMKLFNLFRRSSDQGTPRKPGSPSNARVGMKTSTQSPSHSRDATRRPQLLSSGTSVISQSTSTSAQSSSFPRKTEKGWVHDINKYNLMAKHIYRSCKKNSWLEGKASESCVALRTFQEEYILYPPEDTDEKYEKAVKGLNVEVQSQNFLFLTIGLCPGQFRCRQSHYEKYSTQHV